MPERPAYHYLTGNDLLTGEVVFRAANGAWVAALNEAELLDDPAIATAHLREAETLTGQVVGPYLAQARTDGAAPQPAHFRERFRATGPSNYAHGKQEHHQHV
jgi:hypothetical protein